MHDHERKTVRTTAGRATAGRKIARWMRAACADAAGASAARLGSARAIMRRELRRLLGEEGSATAEYAVATMAAVGFAGLLIVILRGDEVRGILTELVRHALTVG